MVLATCGTMILFFCSMYAYEKLIQRYDPGLRLPWTYEKAEFELLRQQGKKPAKRRHKSHLKVVK